MGKVTVLGVFVADCTFRAERPPRMGETVLGKSFSLGPGGKGSNQAVAAARAGGEVRFVSKLGDDDFARLAADLWAEAGVIPAVTRDANSYTGAAYIYVDDATGNNAIIIAPGAAASLTTEDVAQQAEAIAAADVFLTQLEQPAAAAHEGLRLAREAGAYTILNPAPAAMLPDAMIALCDLVTPNESEAETLTGIKVGSVGAAEMAARALLAKGARSVIVTLGGGGALFVESEEVHHVSAIKAGPLVETTGAGDALNGGYAVALAEGADPVTALRFATATAALSVTRPGAAASMPERSDIDSLTAEVFGRAI